MKTPGSNIHRLAVALGVSALVACSSVSITTDYDRSAPFERYRTYSYATASKGERLSPTAEAALRDSLRRQLAARGIREVQRGRADLAVVRHVFLREKTDIQQYTDWGYGYGAGWPYRFGYYNMWAGAPRTYTDVDQYTVGTLILDFVDRRTNKLVFRGIAKAVVEDPEANAGKVRTAVEEIIDEFPRPRSD